MPEYQRNFGVSGFRSSAKDNPSWPKVYAEGDSWFAFPDPLDEGHVLRWLARNKRYSLLSRAVSGHTIESMLGAKQRLTLISDLEKYSFDVILLSAGGNDFVGEGLIHLLKPWKDGMKPADALNTKVVKGRFALMESALGEFVELCGKHQPGVPILTHNYGVPFVTGKKAKVLLGAIKRGPWIQPSMEQRQIPPGKRRAVMRELMKQLDQTQAKFSGPLKVVKTRHLLNNVKLWADELHPKKAGFKAVANAFRKEIAKAIS